MSSDPRYRLNCSSGTDRHNLCPGGCVKGLSLRADYCKVPAGNLPPLQSRVSSMSLRTFGGEVPQKTDNLCRSCALSLSHASHLRSLHFFLSLHLGSCPACTQPGSLPGMRSWSGSPGHSRSEPRVFNPKAFRVIIRQLSLDIGCISRAYNGPNIRTNTSHALVQ